jgi:hypothetical protein
MMEREIDMVHRTTEAASAPIGHPAGESVSLLDLQQFCGADECRHYLMKPFSRDGFTYATNGHIMVRVVLRPEVPDVDKKFNQEGPLKDLDGATFFRPSFELPPKPEVGECPTCKGRGVAHECPDCECQCGTCDGSGESDGERLFSTSIGLKSFSLSYVRQVLSLPAVELATLPEAPDEKPLLFRFADGVGALMPMRGERANHVDIKLVPA